MDDLNAGFPAPSWQDDAPDKGDVVPFYNTESIEKIIDGFNALRSKASAYLNDESRFSKADFPPMVEFGTRTDTEQETAISRKEKRAREEIGKVEEAAKTYVKQDTADGIHAKPFFNSDVIDNVAGGLANLAGMSTAAYLHYKSIIQQPIAFPPLMNFGTFTPPDQRDGNPTVDRVQLASDFLKTANDFYGMYKQYTNQTTTQKEVEQPPEKAPLPVEETVPEMEPLTEEVPPVEEVLPEKTNLPDETSPPPVEVPPVEEVHTLPELQAPPPQPPPEETEIGEGEEETGEIVVHPTEETEAVEPIISESVITRLIEPHIEKALSKGLSATQVSTFSPVLSSVLSTIVSSNETLYTATANALLESTVAGMLSKVMPHTQALKVAPVLMDAVSAAIKNNASFETASSEVLEAAILPILSVAATGWLTPYFGFGLSAVIGTAGSRLVYDTAKNVAAATMDVIKKVDEIKREIREAEEAKNKATAEQNAPPSVTLQSMQNVPDQVIIEEIEDSLQTTQSVKRAMYAQEDNMLSDNKPTLVEKTSIGDDIKEELFNNKRRKLSQPSSDTRSIFTRDVDLNGMPVYRGPYIMRRADDELRTPLI